MLSRKKFLLFSAGFLAVLAAAIAFTLSLDNGPWYRGHTLAGWAAILRDAPDSADSEEALEAIRNIGTAAVPCALRWIESGNSNDEGIGTADKACFIFEALGTNGNPAMAKLTMLAIASKNQMVALRCVVSIGQPALPALLAVATNGTGGIRPHAIHAITRIQADATAARPVLRTCLKDPNVEVAVASSDVLLKLQLRSGTLSPALVDMLESPIGLLRRRAQKALAGGKRISPRHITVAL